MATAPAIKLSDGTLQRISIPIDHGQETALTLDPKTGFLESLRKDRVTAKQKWEILEIFRGSGNFTDACRAVGIDPRLGRWHLQHDEAFNRARQECYEQLSDGAEGAIIRNMDKAPAYPIFWLKSHRPQIYGDRVTQVHEHSVKVVKQIADDANDFDRRRQPKIDGPKYAS